MKPNLPIPNDDIGWGILKIESGEVYDEKDPNLDLHTFPTFTIGSKQEKRLRTQPHVTFRPIYIRCITDSKWLQLQSVRVGNQECMIPNPGFPLAWIQESDMPLFLPTIGIEQIFGLLITNPKIEDAFLKIWLEGYYIKKR